MPVVRAASIFSISSAIASVADWRLRGFAGILCSVTPLGFSCFTLLQKTSQSESAGAATPPLPPRERLMTRMGMLLTALGSNAGCLAAAAAAAEAVLFLSCPSQVASAAAGTGCILLLLVIDFGVSVGMQRTFPRGGILMTDSRNAIITRGLMRCAVLGMAAVEHTRALRHGMEYSYRSRGRQRDKQRQASSAPEEGDEPLRLLIRVDPKQYETQEGECEHIGEARGAPGTQQRVFCHLKRPRREVGREKLPPIRSTLGDDSGG